MSAENHRYTLKIESASAAFSFRYRARLVRSDRVEVADDFFLTIWGARMWARRKARKDRRKRVNVEFEVQA